MIFFSDNGPGAYGSVGPLSRGKGTVFEGGIRVPGILRWPGRLEAGGVRDQVGIGMDLTASMLRVAGAAAPPDRPLDGIDLVALLETDAPSEPRTLFWRMRRQGRDRRAVREGDVKYVYNREVLFDLAADPAEARDLSEHRPETFERLRRMMDAWMAETAPER